MNPRHWSVDTEAFRKKDPLGFRKWALEQRINFGVRARGEDKISERDLKQFWNELILDPTKRKYLDFLIWDQPSSPSAKNNS